MTARPLRRPSRRQLRGVIRVVLGLLLVTGCVAAVLCTALVGAGLTAKAASDRFLAMPADLRPSPLPQRTVLVDAAGTPFAWLWKENRQVVALEQVAPVMRQALVDIEDDRFYENSGIDLRAQQYVKNLRLAQADTDAEREQAQDDTYQRKVQEARYALQLSRTLSKDEILAGYLNLVFFGNGAYGVQAAAERYFDVDAADLTLPQAALLAGLVKNPSALEPNANPADARERRDVVLDRMAELGSISPAEHAAARAAPLGLRAGGPVAGCAGASGYFCDAVLQTLLAAPRFGPDPQTRRAVLETGGFTIRTTLDPKVQAAADAATRRARGSRAALAAAVVQPGSGQVLALSGSAPFGVQKGATSVDLPLGGSSGFQSGSTFKVFVLAQAVGDGLPLDLEIDSPQVYVADDNGTPYPVANAGDSEAGRFTLEEATELSVNTYFIQLQARIGIDKPARLAEAMGVRRADGGPLQRVPSFTLGTNEVTPLAMAGAYATLAARGRHCSPHAVLGIDPPASTGPGGRPAAAVDTGDVRPPTCRQVMSSPVADTVTRVLTGVVTKGTGRAADPGRPAAGKTGTVQDYSAAWFVGYTSELAAAVWMGDPRGGYRYPLRDVEVDGTTYPQVYGGDVPARTWAALVREALRGTPARGLPTGR